MKSSDNPLSSPVPFDLIFFPSNILDSELKAYSEEENPDFGKEDGCTIIALSAPKVLAENLESSFQGFILFFFFVSNFGIKIPATFC